MEVTKRDEDGYKLSTGKEELSLSGISSYATEGSIAKLRSVARIDNVGKSKVVVPNNFTSLINIPSWSQDSEIYRKNFSSMDIEDDDSIYTSLAQLNSMPLSKHFITKMNAKTGNTMLRSKLQVHQLQISSKLLNSMMKRRILSVMLRERIQLQFTDSTLSALMKVCLKTTNLVKFGFSLTMEKEVTLLTESNWAISMNFPTITLNPNTSATGSRKFWTQIQSKWQWKSFPMAKATVP